MMGKPLYAVRLKHYKYDRAQVYCPVCNRVVRLSKCIGIPAHNAGVAL